MTSEEKVPICKKCGEKMFIGDEQWMCNCDHEKPRFNFAKVVSTGVRPHCHLYVSGEPIMAGTDVHIESVCNIINIAFNQEVKKQLQTKTRLLEKARKALKKISGIKKAVMSPETDRVKFCDAIATKTLAEIEKELGNE